MGEISVKDGRLGDGAVCGSIPLARTRKQSFKLMPALRQEGCCCETFYLEKQAVLQLIAGGRQDHSTCRPAGGHGSGPF